MLTEKIRIFAKKIYNTCKYGIFFVTLSEFLRRHEWAQTTKIKPNSSVLTDNT